VPTLNELMTARADALDEIPEELFGAIERAQRDAYRQVSKLLGRLDLNSAGNIELTTKNLALIEQIAGVTNQTLFTGEYINAVRDFAAKIETQSQFAAKYMDQAFGSFTDNDIYQQILRTSQADAVALLNENAVNQALVEPIKQSLRNSVTTNASFPDAVKNIQQIMIGSAERESNLLGNRKTLIKDAFSIADRRYNIAIEDQYEFEWYRYAGGRVEDTRCFCQKRANKYYRRSEIESWGRLEKLGECRTSNGWAGRIPGTNERSIFTYVGGYNCNHIIVAVPEEAVPDSYKKQEVAKNASTDDWDQAQENQDEWRKTLSNEEIEAVTAYTSSDYKRINNTLRKGAYTDRETIYKQLEQDEYNGYIKQISKAFDSAPRYTGTTYRGAYWGPNDDLTHFNNIAAMEKGSIYTDKGFMSASSSKSVRDSFLSSRSDSRNVEMELFSKQGVAINKFSRYPKENEVLYNAKSKWVVEEIEKSENLIKLKLKQIE